MNFAACDFESYFDDSECSIKLLGTDGYILHPKWHCYLVSIVTDTGFEWVGDPTAAPWDKISGPEWSALAHNASFDERVAHYLRKWGVIPAGFNPRWFCTADLCAFSAAPRALAQASAYLFGEKVAKDYRSLMKGQLFADLTPEKQELVKTAGLVDARTCLRFWKELSPKWSETISPGMRRNW